MSYTTFFIFHYVEDDSLLFYDLFLTLMYNKVGYVLDILYVAAMKSTAGLI